MSSTPHVPQVDDDSETAALTAAVAEARADPRAIPYEEMQAWLLRLAAGEFDAPLPIPRLLAAEISNPAPGDILSLEFLEPMGISQNALARAIGVPPRRISEIVRGRRSITADTDLRLARYFGLSEGFWLGLQADYELMRRRREIGAELSLIIPREAA